MNLQEYISTVESNINDVQNTFGNYVRILKQLETNPEILLTDFYAILKNPVFTVADWNQTVGKDVLLPLLKNISVFSGFQISGGINCINIGSDIGETLVVIEPPEKSYTIIYSDTFVPNNKKDFWKRSFCTRNNTSYEDYIEYYNILNTCNTGLFKGIKMAIHSGNPKIQITHLLNRSIRKRDFSVVSSTINYFEKEYDTYLKKIEYKTTLAKKYKNDISALCNYLATLGYVGKQLGL